jgi:hypothetical protein
VVETKLSQEGQQDYRNHAAGKEGCPYAELAKRPADRPSDCAKDSQINGGEMKLHAVILAADSAEWLFQKHPLHLLTIGQKQPSSGVSE